MVCVKRKFGLLYILKQSLGCTIKHRCFKIRLGISHPSFYGDILQKARKAQYSPKNKVTNPLNRLIRKGYTFVVMIINIVVKSLKIVIFGIKCQPL